MGLFLMGPVEVGIVPTVPSSNQWMNTDQVIDALGGVHTPRYVYGLVNDGVLPAYRFGRVIRYRTADVQTLLGTNPPPTPVTKDGTLSPARFGELVGLSREKVLRFIKQGMIEATVHGNWHRIPPGEVDRLRDPRVRRLLELGIDPAADHDDAVLIEVLVTGLSTTQAAERLGLSAVRLRQLIKSERRLYAFEYPGWRGLLLPSWQFNNGGQVPGIDRVLPYLDHSASPSSITQFFATTNRRLDGMSPVDWLRKGGDPALVVEELSRASLG